jgi:hypothetical protein
MESSYRQTFNGLFTSLLQWEDLARFWEQLKRGRLEEWYIYAVGEAPPASHASAEGFLAFIEEIDLLLRREHAERICGIVYTNHADTPTMVKIYDPNNLGLSCGSSKHPPLPGWILSREQPVDLQPLQLLPNNRRQWWQRLFG